VGSTYKHRRRRTKISPHGIWSFCSTMRPHPYFDTHLRLYLTQKKPAFVAATSSRASLGRRTVYGRTEQRRPPVSKRYETKVRMVWGSFLIAAAALKTPTENGYAAQDVNLMFCYTRAGCAPLASCPLHPTGIVIFCRRATMRTCLFTRTPPIWSFRSRRAPNRILALSLPALSCCSRRALARVFSLAAACICACLLDADDCIPPRDISSHQDSTGTALSGTPPPAQPPPPPQTQGTQSHSAPTPLKRPMLAPEGGPRPRVSA